MKSLKNAKVNKVIIDIKINGRKYDQYKVHTDDFRIKPIAVATCINNPNSCSDELTRDLVTHLTKNLSFKIAHELLWQKGKMKQILSDAFEIAPSATVEEEIISMQFQLLPLIERIYNPLTNALSKTDLQHFKPYKTMDDVLSVLFGASLVDIGALSFDARVER